MWLDCEAQRYIKVSLALSPSLSLTCSHTHTLHHFLILFYFFFPVSPLVVKCVHSICSLLFSLSINTPHVQSFALALSQHIKLVFPLLLGSNKFDIIRYWESSYLHPYPLPPFLPCCLFTVCSEVMSSLITRQLCGSNL